MLSQRLIRSLSLAGTTFIVLGLATIAQSGQAAAAAKTPSSGIWISGGSTTSFQAAVLASVRNRPASLKTAIRVVEGQLARYRSVPLVSGATGGLHPTSHGLRTALQTLVAWKISGSIPKMPPVMTSLRLPISHSSPSSMLAPASVPKRGEPINNNRSWTFNLYLYGEFCDTQGCTLEDEIKQRWTIDGGATSDRFAFVSVYSPDHTGGFHNVYVNAYNNCAAEQYNACGARQYPPAGDPRNGKGSGSFSVSHSSTAGSYQNDEVDLYGSYTPSGTVDYDAAITGRAKCPKSGACVFSP